jgi:hypothetical protein
LLREVLHAPPLSLIRSGFASIDVVAHAHVPGRIFCPQGGHANTLRLNFVAVPPELVAQGVSALGQVLKAC